jgi:lipopolysaccharide/colanic/teichoic acid biosynthesis glycosyltransferase
VSHAPLGYTFARLWRGSIGAPSPDGCDERARRQVVLVGAGPRGRRAAGQLLRQPPRGIELVGLLDESPGRLQADLAELPVFAVGNVAAERVRIRRVATAAGKAGANDLDLFAVAELGSEQHRVRGLAYAGARRPLEATLAAALLVVLSPLFVALALAIKVESPGPVIFRQPRRGTRGRMFRMLKFRTMVDSAHERLAEIADLNVHATYGDTRMFKAADDPRVTRVGKLLRRFALDELPQLVNVLRGEMSLVGPRPLMLEEDHNVPGWARQRLSVRPGVTGLWQVLGRNEIPFHEMLLLDNVYASARTLRLDLSLIARTPRAILRTHRGY